jgi:hypothetical protein
MTGSLRQERVFIFLSVSVMLIFNSTGINLIESDSDCVLCLAAYVKIGFQDSRGLYQTHYSHETGRRAGGGGGRGRKLAQQQNVATEEQPHL